MVAPTGKGDVRLRALRFEPQSPGPISVHANEIEVPLPRGSQPITTKRGSWLNTVRGLRGNRSSHTIEVERRAFDLGEARARGGEDAVRLHQLAHDGASPRQLEDLALGEMSWASVYRLAAKGAFGANFSKPLRYARIEAKMKSLGLERELEAMLADLPRRDLDRLRKSGISPLEVFTARAQAIGSWNRSTHPMTIDELRAELIADGKQASLDALPAADRTKVESGKLSGVEIAKLLQAREREDVDVLVIGAGAGGVGAANELLDSGLSVTVLEAKSRDGGRAFTEEGLMGFPFDHGCAWIHESTKNPILPIVEALGYRTVQTEKFQKVFVGGDPKKDAALLRERMDAVGKRWQAAAKNRPDAKASMVSTPEHRLDPMAAEVLGPLELALELDQFSVGEFQCIVEEKDDRLVEGGLGNVVHAFAHGLPIELDCPVHKVEWSKDGVKVEVDGRTFRAKQMVLSVSPHVLKQIEFVPPLPEWKIRAIERLQMASFEKIALRFAPGTLDRAKPFERACGIDRQGRPYELMLRPWGTDTAVVMVGGDFAKELLQKSEKVAVDYALGVLSEHYGEHLRGAFEIGERTAWTIDPDVGGTWAVAKVGAEIDRAAYAAPVDDTLFITGEACGGAWAATVNGALFSGHDAGKAVAKVHAARAAV